MLQLPNKFDSEWTSMENRTKSLWKWAKVFSVISIVSSLVILGLFGYLIYAAAQWLLKQ